jgi:hypothetical protein
MRNLALACMALGMSASGVQADFITVNSFSNNTPAIVTFNDGSGSSGPISTVLTQLNVTYSAGAGTPITFSTFSIDLFHSASVGESYAVNSRNDLSAAFSNGGRIAYIFQTFGLQDLTNNSVQAAAVQIALWDLSLSNHNPTSLVMDGDGSFSSGDPDVFSVSLGGNPNTAQIVGLANQYLSTSVGATGQAGWLDASVGGAGSDHGPSLVRPVPEPSSISMCIAAASCLSVCGLRRVGQRLHLRGGDQGESAVTACHGLRR